MNRGLLAIVLLLASCAVLAQSLSRQELRCLHQLRDESDFIISRINMIQHDYEHQLRHSQLGRFRSGAYSTKHLLDNTIRKYHRRLVHQIRDYPIRYETRIRAEGKNRHTPCLAQRLRDDSVGTIYEFDQGWQKALQRARQNARYFQQLQGMD